MDEVRKELTEAGRRARSRLEEVKRSKPTHKQMEQILAADRASKQQPLRKTGIDILGDVPWGTHFCLFYESKQDLIDILVPYFKTGLENNEFCMWVTSEPLNAQQAKKALERVVKDLDGHIKKGQIEILDYTDWYTKSGRFEADKVLQGWVEKESQALKGGFAGLRLTGNTLWLEKKDWAKFTEYEAVVNSVIGKYKMLAVCTYSLDKCGASEILDVEHNHQFALIKWRGDWKVLESSSRNQFEARLAEQTAIAHALERSKKEWEKTFNAMSDWVVLIDLKGRILRTNRAGEDFTGVPLAEIVGQSCCRLVHGSDKHTPGCPLLKMTKTGWQASAELQVPGTDQWVMVTVDPVTDEKGKLIGAVHITRDITERKRAERAIRESEERYRYLFEQSPAGIGLTTPDGKMVAANKQMEVITGYFEEELKKINLADTYENPEDRKRLLETIQRYGCAVDFPVRKRRKDGTVYEALLNVSRVHLGGQDLFQTICMDITERKHAEEEIQISEERYRTLVESCHEVILRKDREGHYHTLNLSAAIGLGGTCIEDIEGKTDYELLPKGQADALRKIDKEVMESSKDIEVEEVVRNAQGEDRIYLSRKRPIYDSQGRVNGITCFAMDITERKRAEAALRASEKLAAKGQLAAQIAHEINNPLAGIKNSFMLLKDAIPKEHRYYPYLGRISKEIDRISGIVHKMFGLYKPESETARDFLLDETIGEVVALLEPVCRQHEVAIAIDSSDKAAMVTLPEAPLTQVLYNIVKNAIEASPKGGEVRIAEKITADVLTITVCDEGNGIAEDLRTRIFEPLFTTKRGFGTAGLGLGLSVSKNIVETMGGSVYFESKAGQGTVFSIILPLGGRRKGV